MKLVELFQPLNEYRQKIQGADLSSLAQNVWAVKSVDAKKAALHAMINAYKFKENQEKHRRLVTAEMSAPKLDMLAKDFMLSGEGHKVIK